MTPVQRAAASATPAHLSPTERLLFDALANLLVSASTVGYCVAPEDHGDLFADMRAAADALNTVAGTGAP